MIQKYAEKEVTFGEKYKLKGTLSLPGNLTDKAPAVLFIHGSGPLDRNENAKRIQINAFKYLSAELANMGFVTLRYDKRGCGASEGNFIETGLWDLVDDAESAANFLKEQTEVDANKILLLGHSEGCAIAPVVHDRIHAQGIVLLAGFVGCLMTTSQHQIDSILEEIKKMPGLKGMLLRLLVKADKVKKQNEQVWRKVMESNEAVMRIRGKKLNAKWMREHYSFNVNPYLEKIESPVLALVGSKDVQVFPEHTKQMGALIKGPFEFHVIEEMNHMLRNQPEPVTIMDLMKLYKQSLKKPLEPKVIEILTKWASQFLA